MKLFRLQGFGDSVRAWGMPEEGLLQTLRLVVLPLEISACIRLHCLGYTFTIRA